MKSIIICGFFAIILTVFAVPHGNRTTKCVDLPFNWIMSGIECLKNTSMETIISFTSYNKAEASKEAKCKALCLYNYTGEFVDGGFDSVAIENDLRKHFGAHVLVDKLVRTYQNAADAGNAEDGDDCDKAYAYTVVLSLPENRRVVKSISC